MSLAIEPYSNVPFNVNTLLHFLGVPKADGTPVPVSLADPLWVALGGTVPLPAGAATAAKQDTQITAEQAILAKLTADPATQTTLAAILAKLLTAPATEAKQDTGNTSLASILAKLQVGSTNVNIVRATSTGTAATLIVARPTRSGALIRNLDTANSVWVGPAPVTTSNGFIIKAGESLPITWVGLVQIIDDNTNHAAVAVIDEYY